MSLELSIQATSDLAETTSNPVANAIQKETKQTQTAMFG